MEIIIDQGGDNNAGVCKRPEEYIILLHSHIICEKLETTRRVMKKRCFQVNARTYLVYTFLTLRNILHADLLKGSPISPEKFIL